MAVYELEVVQFLPLYQGNSKYNPTSVFVTQVLTLNHEAKNFRRWYSASNNLQLAQLATCRQSIRNISVTQYLDLHHGGHRAAGHEQITQYLILGQVARPVEYEIVQHTLSITQSVEVTKCLAIFQTLVLTQTVGITVIRNIEVTQTIIIHSGGTAYIEDDDSYNIALPTLTGPNTPECHL